MIKYNIITIFFNKDNNDDTKKELGDMFKSKISEYNLSNDKHVCYKAMNAWINVYIAFLSTEAYANVYNDVDEICKMYKCEIAVESQNILEFNNDFVSYFMDLSILERIEAVDKLANFTKTLKPSDYNKITTAQSIIADFDPRISNNQFVYTEEELMLLNDDNDTKDAKDIVEADDELDEDEDLYDDEDDYESDEYKYKMNKENNKLNAKNEINNLLGCNELKEYVNELDLIADSLSNLRQYENYPNEHMIWAIDKGHGCSTILRKFTNYIDGNNLYKFKKNRTFDSFGMVEKVFTLDKNPFADMENSVRELITDLKYYDSALVGIHIDSFLSDIENRYLADIMKFCVEKKHDIIFVFIIPYVDQGVLNRVEKSISNYLNVRTIKFPSYTDDELIIKLRENLAEYEISLDPSAEKSFKRMLNKERSDGRFYGMQTIDKLSTELTLLKIKNYTNNITSSSLKLLVDEDFKEYFEVNEISDEKGSEQLSKMVGLAEVKKRIEEIVAAIKVEKAMYENGMDNTRPCYHMMFTGNPGTGKTEIARIVGKIFYENGLLPVGDLLEVSRVDLVAQFIGQTGPKTVSVCNNAMGSVLFIDEAYMLAAGNGDRSGKDFGTEALGALIAEMENKRDKFIVIMAGYEEDMEELFKINSGLKQRVPHRIHFNNYNREELFEIYKLQISKSCDFNDEFISEAKKFFEGINDEILKSPEFSNARFVRNLADRTRIKALLRHTYDEDDNLDKIMLIKSDFNNAIFDEDIKSLCHKSGISRIGFKK